MNREDLVQYMGRISRLSERDWREFLRGREMKLSEAMGIDEYASRYRTSLGEAKRRMDMPGWPH